MSELVCLPLPMEGPDRDEPLDFEQLRIIITGTPKTGNTWLKHLLGQLYQLPQVDLDPSFHHNDFEGFGRRWVGQQHYHPDPDIIEAGRTRGIVFIAPLRHPGDVLVSLRHHIQHRGPAEDADELTRTLLPESMLADGEGAFGPNTRQFVEDGFFINLHLSICWLRSRWAMGVRYEDLWLRPVDAFKRLTDRLVPMSERELRHALCACEIGLMQQNYNPDKSFVRKGGLGSWREVLPDDICEVLSTHEPYPEQFQAMGYTMNPGDPANVRVTEPAEAGNPFKQRQFDNGIPVAPIHLRAYFEHPHEALDQWPDGCATAGDSFYAWLMRTAQADPEAGKVIPVITEFCHWLYLNRPDVQEAFPDLFGVDRQKVGDWFLFSACAEYRFDRHFALPVLRSWATGLPETVETGAEVQS